MKDYALFYGIKKMMSKKGLAMTTMVVFALILIVFFVLLFFMQPIKSAFTNFLIKQNCKNSVEFHALGHVKGIDLVKEINCPTQYIEIKGKNEELIKKKIAEDMWTCWDNFGRGEYALFNPSSEKFCVICSVISFEDKKIRINDFSEQLVKSPSPVKGADNLYEAMSGFSTDDVVFNPDAAKDIEDSIDTKNDYAVSFVYIKKDYWDKLEAGGTLAVVGFAAGFIGGVALVASGVGAPAGVIILTTVGGTMVGGLGGFFGASAKPTDWAAGVSLIPISEIDTLECTYLPVAQNRE